MSTDNVGYKTLGGADGYYNGVSYLDQICEAYGKGKGAIGARSVNIADINRATGYNPEKTGNNEIYGNGTMYQYLNQVEISWDEASNTFSFKGDNGAVATATYKHWILNDETKKVERFDEKNNGQKIESNYYTYFPTTLTTNDAESGAGLSKESDAYKLLFRNSDNSANAEYWLADSFTRAITGYFVWGVRAIKDGEVQKGGYFLFSSDGIELAGINKGVRAVVRISSSANLEPNASGIMEIV